MSVYSDYKCGALSEREFSSLAARENRKEREYVDEWERLYYEDDNTDLVIDTESED